MNREIRFLTVDDILMLHKIAITRFGGMDGIRDFPLLESATAMATATYEGHYLHTTLYEMAAAYTFHLSQNQPFIDGNKRTGLLAGLVFLDINGITISQPSPALYESMINIATGRGTKAQLADLLEQLADKP